MHPLRAFFSRHRALALLLVMATLCMKALVPAGYMVGDHSKVLTIQLCHEGFGGAIAKQIVIPVKSESTDSPGGKQDKGECPFSALTMASMAGADPALLALALAFILALGFAPVRTALPGRILHLRPPLRGPPALV